MKWNSNSQSPCNPYSKRYYLRLHEKLETPAYLGHYVLNKKLSRNADTKEVHAYQIWHKLEICPELLVQSLSEDTDCSSKDWFDVLDPSRFYFIYFFKLFSRNRF